MDCFHDFCLACDKSCTDGAYCSQACRMLDLEKAQMSRSPTTSPRNITHSGWSVSTTSYGQSPAYVPTTSRDSYFTQPSTRTYDTSSGRMLSPSSSRTSLSSTTSTTSATVGMTEQARAELSGYFASFDQVRAARRRSSLR